MEQDKVGHVAVLMSTHRPSRWLKALFSMSRSYTALNVLVLNWSIRTQLNCSMCRLSVSLSSPFVPRSAMLCCDCTFSRSDLLSSHSCLQAEVHQAQVSHFLQSLPSDDSSGFIFAHLPPYRRDALPILQSCCPSLCPAASP